uniref:Ycf27 n=1 Tax=Chattonella marina TaxID=90936 RepID=UPI002113B7E7|nr:Ycf27 [Chattonella marina]UTE94866.1 Ycf27 [Chattonella marina]
MNLKNQEKILIVEDQINIRRILSKRLKNRGYKTLTTSNGREALKLLSFFLPDLIILDIMLPGINGYEICKQIRKKSSIPIIFLTALGTVGDQVKGFEIGATDYIVKPFSIEEIEHRIFLALKKTIKEKNQDKGKLSKINIGKIKIDFKKRSLLKEKLTFRLTEIEIKLLKLFLNEKDKVFSREEIINRVWGFNSFNHSDSRIVDVYISKLRSKIEDEPNNPQYIHTIRGAGYKFSFKKPTL